jgi:hypothetical protein
VRSDIEGIVVRPPNFACLMRKLITASAVGHPNMRFAFCSAALLAGGLLLASFTVASAQGQEAQQKPPEQGEQKPQAKGEQKPEDQKSAEQQAEERIKQEIEEYRDAAARLSLSAGSAECVWTGRRITSLLWRDDVDTARRYLDLYDRFGCSAEHLKLTFRCVIRQGPIDPKAADRLAARVHDCWLDPDGTTTAASRTTTGSPAKSGTIPN